MILGEAGADLFLSQSVLAVLGESDRSFALGRSCNSLQIGILQADGASRLR